jgi:MFS family permease
MTTETAGAAGRRKAEAPAAQVASSTWPSARVAYYTAFVLILSTACSQLDIVIVQYLGPYIEHDLHLTDYNFSLMVGLSFGLFYTAVGVPIAWFLDRFSRKRLLALAITVWSIGTALCGVAQNYTQLFLARFLVGAGEAVNGPAAYSITADLFPRERMPRGVAILQIGSVLGPGLATLISVFALKSFAEIRPIPVPFGVIHGWQLIFMVVGLPGVVIALLMLTTMPEPKRQTIQDQVAGFTETPRTLLGGLISVFQDYGLALAYILRQWKVFGPMFLSLLIGSLGTGAIAFGPIFYMRNFGWKPAQLAQLNLIPSFILMPIGLVIGVWIAEQLQKRGRSDAALMTQIISRLIALPALLYPLMPNPWLAWGLGTLTLFSIGIGGPAQNAAFQIVTPTELRGKMTALYLFIYSVVGVALAPVVIGFISTKIVGEANIKWAIFVPTVIFGPISLLITWLGLKPYGREVERLKALEGQAARSRPASRGSSPWRTI